MSKEIAQKNRIRMFLTNIIDNVAVFPKKYVHDEQVERFFIVQFAN